MILAGIFNKSKNDTFAKLVALTKKYIKKESTFFENDLVSVVMGKTSDTVCQGALLKSTDSVLIGKVFRKDNYKSITKKELAQQSKEPNKSFVNKYWGNYLLINTDIKNKTVRILRDPVGQLPLFYTKLESGDVLFSSNIEILYRMTHTKQGFNWRYLSAYLVHGAFATDQTAFNDIYELPHGCELFIGGVNNFISQFAVWNPLDYCKPYKKEQFQKNIIETMTNVIKSWTKNTEGALLEFSGGTDSTGLLFLLNKVLDKHQVLKPINGFHPKIASSDERKYALAATNEIGIELIEYDTSNCLPLDPIFKKKDIKPNWPTNNLISLKAQNIFNLFSKNYKNITHMSGHGGDHVFMCPTPRESLCDYLIEKGIKGFGKKLKDISIMFRQPLFPIIKDIVKGFFCHYFYPAHTRLLLLSKNNKAPWFSRDIFKLKKHVSIHPIFYCEKFIKVPPGKLKHIYNIYKGLATIKAKARDKNTNPVFYPFFTQPMLELVLSMPTYASFHDGYNRYPFRKAISDAFKTNTVWRKDKGETSGVMQKAIKKNEDYVLDLCLKGKAAQMDIIDKTLAHKDIQRLMYGKAEHQWPITNLLNLEIFLNYWDN